MGLHCQDGSVRQPLEACEASCVAIAGCSVIYLHDIDKHCHTCVGNITRAQYEADLRADRGFLTCLRG